jgi:biotin carboxyl carrier protein
MILRCGPDRREAELQGRTAEGVWRVVVDGRTFEVRVERVAEGIYRVRVGGQAETLHAVSDGATLHFQWQGRAYRLVRETPRQRSRAAAAGTLDAPMPGRVAMVHVQPGQAVTQGQALLVIEAMKMENVVRAPRDGQVKTVHVAVGARVAPGTPLVELS